MHGPATKKLPASAFPQRMPRENTILELWAARGLMHWCTKLYQNRFLRVYVAH